MQLKWFTLFEKDKGIFVYTLVFTILAIVFVVISRFNDNYSIWRIGNGLMIFLSSFNCAWILASICFAFLNLFFLLFEKKPKYIFPKSWQFLIIQIFTLPVLILFIFDNEFAMARFFFGLKIFLIFWFFAYTAKFFAQVFSSH